MLWREYVYKSAQTTSLLSIVFFGFVGLSLPYPIFSPLFLQADSPLVLALGLSPKWCAILLGLTLAAYPLAQFFGSPILGSLSDRYGRKRLLMLSLIGTGIGYLLSGLAIANHAVGLLIASRILTGFFEGNMGIAQACISDLKYDKYFGLGAISAAASLGYLVGPLLGGFLCDSSLVSWFDFSTPFYFGFIMSLFITLLVKVWFTETRVSHHQHTSLLAEFNIFSKLKQVYGRPTLRQPLLIMFLLSLSIDCYYEFYPAFLVEEWEMSPMLIGLYSATLSLALSIGALWIPQLLKKRKNPTTYQLHLMIVYIVFLALLLFAYDALSLNLHFFIVGLCYSAINTILAVTISDNATEHEQGTVMGLQWGTRMLGDAGLCIIGSLLLWQSSFYPIILSVLLGGATIWFWVTQKTSNCALKLEET